MQYVWFGNGASLWKPGASHILKESLRSEYSGKLWTKTLCGAFNDMMEYAPPFDQVPTHLCKRCEKIAQKEGLQ